LKKTPNRINSVVDKAIVELYLVPFQEKTWEASRRGFTDHRIMKEELKLWTRLWKLKLRACHRNEEAHSNFVVSRESEVFFVFTRKNDI